MLRDHNSKYDSTKKRKWINDVKIGEDEYTHC